METKKISLIFAAAVALLAVTCLEATIQWSSQQQVYASGLAPVIAMKGAVPVIAFAQQDSPYKIGYTEDLGATLSTLGPTYSNNTPDIAVDSEGNTHVVWSRYGSSWRNYYQTQVNGSFVGTTYEDISAGVNRICPQIATDGGIVHVSWRNSTYRDSGLYMQKVNGVWSAVETFDSPTAGKMLSHRLLADADGNAYSFALSRSYGYYLSGNADGPYYDMRNSEGTWTSVLPADINNHDGTANIGYAVDSGLEVVWNGSAVVGACLDTLMNDATDHTTGRVLLYKNLLSTAYPLVPVEVFNDGNKAAGIEASASGVTLGIDGAGNYYVVFSAADPDEGQTDTELFMQMVDTSGNLVGSLQQLTHNSVNDTLPRMGYANNSLHLVWESAGAINYTSAFVPEPMSLLIFGLGGLCFFYRKNR